MSNIRRATVYDLSRMQAILETASRDWSVEVLQDCFSPMYFNWVVVDREKLLGFVMVKNNIVAWEIMQLVVAPTYQRHGLAKQLLQHVLHEANMHVKTVQLEVRASNAPAIELYQHCGFVQTGVRKKYYADGEDAIVMDNTSL